MGPLKFSRVIFMHLFFFKASLMGKLKVLFCSQVKELPF